jgi:hypothetical protein
LERGVCTFVTPDGSEGPWPMGGGFELELFTTS